MGLALVVFAPLYVISPCLATSFTYTTLDDPNATAGTGAFGVNNSGQVVGTYYTNTDAYGYVYNGSTYTDISLPSQATDLQAFGINNNGLIVGVSDNAQGAHAFIYNGSSYTAIDDPNQINYNTLPTAINDSGDVVGTYIGSGPTYHVFTYNGSSFTDLNPPGSPAQFSANGINNSGAIAGFYGTANGGLFEGFVENAGAYSFFSVPGALVTLALGLNNNGDVVGSYDVTDNSPGQGFLYDGSTFTTMDDPLGVATVPFAINDSGEIVGYYLDSNGVDHGFIAQESSSSVSPEPGTLVLLSAAAALVLALKRRGPAVWRDGALIPNYSRRSK
jgi:probable HAF family extracellular repeat protein